MKIQIEVVDNGWVLSEVFDPRFPENPLKVEVVESKESFSEHQEQFDAQRLLWAVMEMLGIHFSNHGPRLFIEVRGINGKKMEDKR